MNYLILNGKISRYIQGLLIQTLPPITKPAMRCQSDEINGRDGDIITELGFDAYDRDVEIGLHGNFDIDEVIGYFNSEGTAVFSNEPNKVYQYKIIKEIDFEKLIRFKTAKITFHVQPFKHSLIEKPLTFEINDETSLEIQNYGNYKSKPVMTIFGLGTVALSLNGSQIFLIQFGSDESITIDVENMEAFSGNALKNRSVSGNYDDFTFDQGINVVSWSGIVYKFIFDKYSRWI